MAKPRHHTLQGICQDLCVNYQQVVEVLRRIRAVCLEENGKVITQEAGTFFCRNVSGRSGVLNGVPWTSDPFIELGLKGERSDKVHSPGGPPLASRIREERIVIPLIVPTSTTGLEFASPPTSFEILDNLEFRFEQAQVLAPVETIQRTGFVVGERGADGEPVGMSNVEVTLGVRFGEPSDRPEEIAGGPYFSVDGNELTTGQSFSLGSTTGVYPIETLPNFDALNLGDILFTLDITYDRGFE